MFQIKTTLNFNSRNFRTFPIRKKWMDVIKCSQSGEKILNAIYCHFSNLSRDYKVFFEFFFLSLCRVDEEFHSHAEQDKLCKQLACLVS